MPTTLAALVTITLDARAVALLLWPSGEPEIVEHVHAELDPSHPHLATARDHRHAHT